MALEDKARRLLDEDRVVLTGIDAMNGVAVGKIRGDHGEYEAKVTMAGSFSCTCTWGSYAAPASHHLCSHALALRIAVGF